MSQHGIKVVQQRSEKQTLLVPFDELQKHIGEMRVVLQKECREDWNQQQPHEIACKPGSPISHDLSVLSDLITVTAQELLYLKLCFVIPATLTSKLLSDLARSNVFHQFGQFSPQSFCLPENSRPNRYPEGRDGNAQ